MSFELLNEEVNKGIEGRNTGIPMGFKRLNKYVGIRRRLMHLIGGATGCLSGTTIVKFNRRKKSGSDRYITLQDLYYKFNKIKVSGIGQHWKKECDTKTLSYSYLKHSMIQNAIVNVVESGIKTTYKVITESGYNIRATLDHKFLISEDGEFKPLLSLSVGDYIICKSQRYIPKGRNPRPYRKEIITKLPYYPSAKDKIVICNGISYTHQRIKRTRAVYDAYLNNVSLDMFIEQVKTNPDHGYIFSDINMDIHHIDENEQNDVPENLILLSKKDHSKLHGDDRLFGNRSIEKERIVSIEVFGIEMTYDIQMRDPNNNFIANGIVVHNSGKSALLHSAYILHPFDYLLKHPEKNSKFKVILFSMERSKVYILCKWISRRIFLEHGVLLPIQKLLGWWDDNKLTHDEHDLFLTTKDYVNNLLTVVDIVEGAQNPTGIYKYVREYAKAHGKIETPNELTSVYIPDNESEIVIVAIDHLGLTKTERGYMKKEAIDKLSEYCQIFRDMYGYIPVCVSQLNRGLSDPKFFASGRSFEPTIDDFKESGNPGEASDIVLSLFEPVRFRTEDPTYKVKKFIDESTGGNYFRRVKILKNSYGEDSVGIGMAFFGALGEFKELPKKEFMENFDYESVFNGSFFL